jgi:hypothetical protein
VFGANDYLERTKEKKKQEEGNNKAADGGINADLKLGNIGSVTVLN